MVKHIIFSCVWCLTFLSHANDTEVVTVTIDRVYAKDLKESEVPYYILNNASSTIKTRENSSIHFNSPELWFKAFEPLRLPLTVYGIDKNHNKTLLKRAQNQLYDFTERYIVDKKYPSIRIYIGNKQVNQSSLDPQKTTMTITIPKEAVQSLKVMQGPVIKNELQEPIYLTCIYSDKMVQEAFGYSATLAAYNVKNPANMYYTKTLFENQATINMSYADGTLIKTLSGKELENLYTAKNPLVIRDLLPIDLTIDNRSDAPITFSKKNKSYNINIGYNNKIKGVPSSKEVTEIIAPHNQKIYTLQATFEKKQASDFSAEENKTIQFTALSVDKVIEVTVSPQDKAYCSASRFTFNLQDQMSPFLAKKELGKPLALTLTVGEATDDDGDVFGESCKKLTFSLKDSSAKK